MIQQLDNAAPSGAGVDVAAVLAPFGLRPAPDADTTFGNRLMRAATDIRLAQAFVLYDHRPHLPDRDRAFPYLYTEEFRRGYAGLKYAVALILEPRVIIEIGVGAGIAAHAMLVAAPEASYLGIDDGSKQREDRYPYLAGVDDLLAPFEHWIIERSSQNMTDLPRADLVHVDGDHTYKGAFHDCMLAWRSGAPWILVDDTRDPEIMRALTDSILGKHAVDWASFEDSWTGSILIHHGEG